MSELVLRWPWAKPGRKVHDEIAADRSCAKLQAEMLSLRLGVEDDGAWGARSRCLIAEHGLSRHRTENASQLRAV